MKTPEGENDQDIVMSLERIGVRYRHRAGPLRRVRRDALREVSFELRRGESLGVVGSNGAGKSTVLKVMSGGVRPDRGELVNKARSTALLSSSLGLDGTRTGRQNAVLCALSMGFRRDEIERSLGEIIAFSELGGFIDYPLRTYSTGMRSRLTFSVVIQLDPDVLLVDEMLSAADPQFQRRIRAELERRVASSRSVVLVSHDSEPIRELSHRVLWLEDGRSLLVGDPEDVVRAYESYMALNPEAQRFFLSMHRQLDEAAPGDELPTRLQEAIEALAGRDSRHPEAGAAGFRGGTGPAPENS
ncbi:MAG: ATP-binding cassette domain-containing protein [Arenicellales bacterium]